MNAPQIRDGLRFGVYLPDADLTVANMDTIELMVACIRRARR